jgi:hypothetical protein
VSQPGVFQLIMNRLFNQFPLVSCPEFVHRHPDVWAARTAIEYRVFALSNPIVALSPARAAQACYLMDRLFRPMHRLRDF